MLFEGIKTEFNSTYFIIVLVKEWEGPINCKRKTGDYIALSSKIIPILSPNTRWVREAVQKKTYILSGYFCSGLLPPPPITDRMRKNISFFLYVYKYIYIFFIKCQTFSPLHKNLSFLSGQGFCSPPSLADMSAKFRNFFLNGSPIIILLINKWWVILAVKNNVSRVIYLIQ